MTARRAAIIFIAFFTVSNANAEALVQKFSSNWSVNVLDYYGTVSALKLQYLEYIPFDSALGKLTSASIIETVSGDRDNSADALQIRESFTTGWDPNRYQFSRDYSIPAGNHDFSQSFVYDFSSTADLARLTNYQYYTGVEAAGKGSGGAWYYFESETKTGAHSISSETTLSYFYTPASSVPEPEILSMLLAGLGLLSAYRKIKARLIRNLLPKLSRLV